jgi:protein SCO1/2
VLSAIILTLFYSALKKNTAYLQSSVNPELVDSTVQYISKYHTIADFHLPIKTGKSSPRKDYDKYMLIFTTCGSICPK